MIKAVIDIGTNSTRLFVAKIKENKLNTILKMLSTTRLGEGILSSPFMLEKAMERTSDKVKEFVLIAKEQGAQEIYVYATAVVREAKNKDVFKKMILDKTGIELDIISGQTEGEIAFLGSASGFENPAVIDIGGGSTEVVTKTNGVLSALSLKTGGVRLKEQFETPSGIIDIAPIKEFLLKNYIPQYMDSTDIKNAKTLIGVSGTPTTLLSLSLGLKEYSPSKIQNGIFLKKDLDDILYRLASLTKDKRREFSGDFKERADIIVFGGCILSSFMEYYNFDNIVVSDRDSLEGYLIKKATE
ncbi:MAG: hypothetical protein E7365_05815 [Clostridiales bacterium]|nr:hypothetical protein [Clostridiales bacterium]